MSEGLPLDASYEGTRGITSDEELASLVVGEEVETDEGTEHPHMHWRSVDVHDILSNGSVDEGDEKKDFDENGEHGHEIGDSVTEEGHSPCGAIVDVEDLRHDKGDLPGGGGLSFHVELLLFVEDEAVARIEDLRSDLPVMFRRTKEVAERNRVVPEDTEIRGNTANCDGAASEDVGVDEETLGQKTCHSTSRRRLHDVVLGLLVGQRHGWRQLRGQVDGKNLEGRETGWKAEEEGEDDGHHLGPDVSEGVGE